MIFNNIEFLSLLVYVYRKNLVTTLIQVLFNFIISAISELIFMIFFVYVLKIKFNSISSDILTMFFVNIGILLIFICILRISIVRKIIVKIMSWYNENEKIELLVLILLVLIIIDILIYPITIKNIELNKMIIYLVVLVGIIVFITGYFKEKSGNNKLTIEYDQLLDYVKTYENEVVEKSKRQHEYNNQLVLLDDMIGPKNKKAKEYIKGLIDNNEEDKNTIW